MSKEIIQVNELCLSYGKRKILDNVNVRFEKGKTVLIAGNNGAGKSSLLKCLAGVLLPDSGEIRIDEAVTKEKIGFISDRMSLFEDFTLTQGIDFHSGMFNVKPADFDRSLLDRLKLDMNLKIKDLSIGERAVYHLSLLLSQKPEVLLVDEIIHTIDPYLRELFLDALIGLIDDLNTSVIMVNHTFTDTGRIPERVLIMEDGGFVYIPSGTVLKTPVHLLYVSTPGDKPSITNPRNLIVSEDNCQADIIEHYVSLDDSTYFSNVVTEMVVGENSTLGHYMLELESKKAFNISTLRVQQARSSNIRSHAILMGGALVRNNVHPVLAGEGCDSLINGLYMSTDRQHMDNYMKVEHVSPHCDSRQLYNGVLDGRSKGVFHGRIIVHKDAQKTDAKQTNRNLLLSDNAQIDTKPQLEIYADDVKCTHGATIGQMDEKAIFYLRSRGISEEDSRDIILSAFTNQTLDSMNVQAVKNYCADIVSKWFAERESARKR